MTMTQELYSPFEQIFKNYARTDRTIPHRNQIIEQIYDLQQIKNQKVVQASRMPYLNLLNQYLLKQKVKKPPQLISSYKTLDCPNLPNNFYLNLLDWSSNNIISIYLQPYLYRYNPINKKIISLETIDIASIISQKDILSITGTHQYCIYQNNKIIRQETENWDGRWSVQAFQKDNNDQSNNILAIGGQKGKIRIKDLRMKCIIIEYNLHQEEICGLTWCDKILSSGGNDNLIYGWEFRMGKEIFCLKGHNAAIKGMAWNGKDLITGGGTKDKRILYWDINNQTIKKQVKTNSQICQILSLGNFIICAQGYPQNTINIYETYENKPKYVLEEHQARILYLKSNPEGTKIASAGGDECLKLWNLEKLNKQEKICKKWSLDQLR